MKRILISLALLTSAVGTVNATPVSPTPRLAPIQNFGSKLVQKAAAWANCLAYIELNATYYDTPTISRLYAEVTSGVATWTITTSPSNGATAKPVSGHGVGWPLDGMVIDFPDSQTANEAAALAMIATNTK